mmetsp:Transcript_42749/g.133981  ORF Transcript_42749/g.133981 Transcript_42749/m.133981 type:complete len:219 (-) Transcript_42749:551-1207(-)
MQRRLRRSLRGRAGGARALPRGPARRRAVLLAGPPRCAEPSKASVSARQPGCAHRRRGRQRWSPGRSVLAPEQVGVGRDPRGAAAPQRPRGRRDGEPRLSHPQGELHRLLPGQVAVLRRPRAAGGSRGALQARDRCMAREGQRRDRCGRGRRAAGAPRLHLRRPRAPVRRPLRLERDPHRRRLRQRRLRGRGARRGVRSAARERAPREPELQVLRRVE